MRFALAAAVCLSACESADLSGTFPLDSVVAIASDGGADGGGRGDFSTTTTATPPADMSRPSGHDASMARGPDLAPYYQPPYNPPDMAQPVACIAEGRFCNLINQHEACCAGTTCVVDVFQNYYCKR